MTCTNCSKPHATAYTYQGITSYLCADCRQRLALAIAGLNRYRAILTGLLLGRRE
jgi:DNA-directed RNA polymerase subunit RPC12/RpoP